MMSSSALKSKLIKAGVSIALALALILLTNYCTKSPLISIIKDLKNNPAVKYDTTVRIDTVVRTVVRNKPIKVYQYLPGDTVTIETIRQDTSLIVTKDSTITKDLRLVYTIYTPCGLAGIGFDYTVFPKEITKTITIKEAVESSAFHYWGGVFTDRRITQYGGSIGLSRGDMYLGVKYNIPDKVLLYDIQYRFK